MKRGELWLRRGLSVLSILGGAVLIGFRGGPAAWLLFWASLLLPLLALFLANRRALPSALYRAHGAGYAGAWGNRRL